jgi:hypothetical protein
MNIKVGRALNIDFSPWKALKSQALVDFVAEWIEIQQPALDIFLDHWKCTLMDHSS